MAESILGLITLLITALRVSSECPPEEGIYLMLGDECISNGTYFRDSDLQIANNQSGYIHCVLPDVTLTGGQWLRPDGHPVNCTVGVDAETSTDPKLKDPFFCTDDSPNANITLYLENDDYFNPTAGVQNKKLNELIETQYKCCLPTDCSDPNTNILTINVFERVYITDVYVDLPPDVTAIPQYYTVHCIVTGSLSSATIKHYYNTDNELTQSYCSSAHEGYSCTVESESITTNYTYPTTGDYTVTVEWEGMDISSGVFSQSVLDGDHEHICTAASGAVGPTVKGLKGRIKSVTVKAPSSAPSIPILVSRTLTSITINWTYPNMSDVDGFVVNCSSSLSDNVIQHDSSVWTTATLNGLSPGTNYSITLRAYQDILGLPSDTGLIGTVALELVPVSINWSSDSLIDNLLDTQYTVQCVTSNTDPSLVYWSVNGAKVSTTSYTLTEETYTSTLLLYPNNGALGQSVSVTCSVEGVKNETVTLEAPPSPQDVSIDVVNASSIDISWSITDSDVSGFIIAVALNASATHNTTIDKHAYSASTVQAMIHKLIPGSVYIITVFAYKDLLSNSTGMIVSLPSFTSTSPSVSSSSTITTTSSSSSGKTVSITVEAPTKTTSEESSGSVPIAAGGAAAGVVVFIVIIIVIVALVLILGRRRRRSSKSNGGIEEKQMPSKTHEVATNESLPPKPYELTSIEEKQTPFMAPEQTTNDSMSLPPNKEPYESTDQPFEPQKESTDYEAIALDEPQSVSPTRDIIYDSVYATPVDVQRDADFDNQIPSINPVTKGDFWSYVNSNNMKAFQQEFRSIYTGDDRTSDYGRSPENKPLNRFRNIIPYDANRIVLRKLDHEDCQGDFINASYIDGYSMPKKFIATQGSMKNTLVDFFRMIWLEKVQVIVMVTNLWELGRSKCERYWPSYEEGEKEFGPFLVKARASIVYSDYTQRNLEIKFGGETRQIVQYQLTSWPDHGVLEYPSPLIMVHKRVMNEWHSLGGPLLVHCSAGVGRTGTFITLDMALEQIKGEGVVDIAGIVTRLRQQRVQMVQTEEQYIFVHEAVLEIITCGDTEITSNTFASQLVELKQPVDPQTGETRLQTQFAILSKVTPSPDDVIKEMAESHSDKNRSDEYLPSDKYIVPLQERDGYINATFTKAYGKLRGMIVAQSPMENTVDDFWKMIIQYRVSAIVMCCELVENGQDTCSVYWPSSEEPVMYSRYQVHQDSETEEQGFIRRNLIVECHEDDTKWKVAQFQITNWSPSGVVTSAKVLLQVFECVTKVQQKTGEGPVIVHCSDTVSRSGVYCAVSNAIEQCKAEGLIDIFQTVKLLRMNKPGAVISIEQYTSVYDTVAVFLASNEAYANFL